MNLDIPRLAKRFNVPAIAIVRCQEWHNCFFVKILDIGWRFVSKRIVRTKVKTVKVKPKETLYRVVRTYDYDPMSQDVNREIGILVQNLKTRVQVWKKISFSQQVNSNDVVFLFKDKLYKYRYSYFQVVEFANA